jgi:hypothetical protein
MARGWRDLKDDLARQPFPGLDAQPDVGGAWWRADAARTLPSLTGDAAVVATMHALCA